MNGKIFIKFIMERWLFGGESGIRGLAPFLVLRVKIIAARFFFVDIITGAGCSSGLSADIAESGETAGLAH